MNLRHSLYKNSKFKQYSTAPNVARDTNENKMNAWQIHSYGGLEELQLSKTARIPYIQEPNDIIVRISASSINPIDMAMMGKSNKMRGTSVT